MASKAFKTQQTIQGLSDLRKQFRMLPERLAKAIVRRGLLAGAAVVRDEVRRKVPVDEGDLQKSIVAETRGIKRMGKGKPVEFAAVVTVRKRKSKSKRKSKGKGNGPGKAKVKNPRRYAHLVEFGTSPRGKHPGTQPQPFMRPAFDTQGPAAAEKIAEVMRRELMAEIDKGVKR